MNDELMHYGIKGQKWGVRRFQNEDGTLTPAGRKKYKLDMMPTTGYDRGRIRAIETINENRNKTKK